MGKPMIEKIRETMKASTSGNKMVRIYNALLAVAEYCSKPNYGEGDYYSGMDAVDAAVLDIIEEELLIRDESNVAEEK